MTATLTAPQPTSGARTPELWRTEGDTVRITPHWGQRRALTSTRRFVWMLAGTQGGKTSLGPVWLEQEMARRGKGDYLAVTSTFPLLRLKMLPEFLRYFDRLEMGEWGASDKAYVVTRADHPANGSRVIFGSASNPESLESATAMAAWLDECGQDIFRLAAWEAIQRRLSLNEGRVLGTTTPYNLGWLKQKVVDAWEAGDTTHDVIQFESIENPLFPMAEFERMRASLPQWRFDMFYRARFSRPAGMIYSDFVDAYREAGGHKVKPFPIPTEWPRHVGIDFGAVNTALVWLAHDPEANVFYLYDESLTGGKTTGQHAAEALQKGHGVNLRSWYAGSKSETQQRMDWQAAGVPVQEPEVADVEAGIDRVIALFKASRLYLFDTCGGLLDELGSYRRELDELGQSTEKIANKETYHRLDALRYASQGLNLPPAVQLSKTVDPQTYRSARYASDDRRRSRF